MDVFRCQVRLRGKVQNVVPKSEVTIPEIYVLRHLHGQDAVVDIKPLKRDAVERITDDEGKTKTRPRTEKEERERLAHLYPRVKLNDLFGVGQRLPMALEDTDTVAAEPDPEPALRRRVGRPPKAREVLAAAEATAEELVA